MPTLVPASKLTSPSKLAVAPGCTPAGSRSPCSSCPRRTRAACHRGRSRQRLLERPRGRAAGVGVERLLEVLLAHRELGRGLDLGRRADRGQRRGAAAGDRLLTVARDGVDRDEQAARRLRADARGKTVPGWTSACGSSTTTSRTLRVTRDSLDRGRLGDARLALTLLHEAHADPPGCPCAASRGCGDRWRTSSRPCPGSDRRRSDSCPGGPSGTTSTSRSRA